MTEFYDDLETRDPAQREADLMAAMPRQIALAKATDGYTTLLRDVDPQTINSRETLAALPAVSYTHLTLPTTPYV